ncbi:MAG: glycosyltransferase, partial [Kaistella sp.]
MPEVSIITPVFNSARFLEQTFDSVFSQTFTDWEWMITDDRSTDHSVEMIQKLTDSRIKLTVADK